MALLLHRSLLWPNLRQNIVAGTRLALFLPVRALDFRVSAADYAALLVASLACWALGSLARVGVPGSVDLHALTVALAQIPVILFGCLVLASLFGEPRLLLAFAVLLVATDPIFELASVALRYASAFEPLAPYVQPANWLFIAWAFATLVRTQWLASGWRGARSVAAGFVLAALLGLFVWVLPRTELWAGVQPSPAAGLPSAVNEEVFHLQGVLLDAQLSELAPERPGVADLYFVGVAAYALQDTFAKELAVVRKLMDERFDTRGRSIVLINHTATLRDVPIATVTNLRAVLEHLGETMNVEEDVVVLHVTTHGSPDYRLSFELPPLELQPLTPSALARMFADSGIKWKVIVLSACFSGGFIEPLRDDNTLIVTAADAQHSSFGCNYESEITWFSKAFFDEALRRTFSFIDAFEQARQSVGAWERADGLEPSNPQIFVGAAMRQKLASVERRLAPRGRVPRLSARVNVSR